MNGEEHKWSLNFSFVYNYFFMCNFSLLFSHFFFLAVTPKDSLRSVGINADTQ